MYLFRNLIAIILLCCSSRCYALLLDQGKGQLTLQLHYFDPTKKLESLVEDKFQIQKQIYELGREKADLELKKYLTPEQKKHRLTKFDRKIAFLKSAESELPSSYERWLWIASAQHAVTSSVNTHLKFLGKQEIHVSGKSRAQIMESEMHLQVQLYKNRRANRLRSFVLSPTLRLSSSPLDLKFGLKGTIEQVRIKKNKTYITQLEAGLLVNDQGHNVYSFGVSQGLKFRNNMLLWMQSFMDLDHSNPTDMYKSLLKTQVSIIKDNSDSNGVSWQIGISHCNSDIFNLPMYYGVFTGIWYQF